MRAPISSNPRSTSAGFCEAKVPERPMRDSCCDRPPARRRSRRSSKPAPSSAWSTSSGAGPVGPSVPSVNTTSVPKRSGTGARSICWVSSRTPSITAPFRLVEGSRGRLVDRAFDAAPDVAAEADHGGEVRAAVEAVDRRPSGTGPTRSPNERRRLDQRRHVPRVDDAAAHVDQQQGVVNRRHLGLQDGLLALQHRDRLLVLVDPEILRRQIGHGLAAVGVDREVDRDVRRLPHRGVHHLQLQPGAPGSETGGERCTRNRREPRGVGTRADIRPAYHEIEERN